MLKKYLSAESAIKVALTDSRVHNEFYEIDFEHSFE